MTKTAKVAAPTTDLKEAPVTVSANADRTAPAREARKTNARKRREALYAERLREGGWTCTPPAE
jgi:hypothetical protein